MNGTIEHGKRRAARSAQVARVMIGTPNSHGENSTGRCGVEGLFVTAAIEGYIFYEIAALLVLAAGVG
ncbi:MAG: hypothetical protein AAF940_02815, partial [Pseudomonadota bacterium]